MQEIKLPQVEVPKKGLSDVFTELMAEAMKVDIEEAKIILKI